MAKSEGEVTEKVDKAVSQTGEVVFYHNVYVPTVELSMSKSEWDRLAGQGLLTNAVFVRSEGAK